MVPEFSSHLPVVIRSGLNMNSFRIAVALLAIGATPVIAQEEEDIDAKAVIESRQSALRDIGEAFKGIMDELKKSTPALASLREHAQVIDTLSKHQHKWFPEGTGQDADVINAAKNEIWERPAEFKAGQTAMSAEAAKLATVTAGTDLAAIKKQAQALGRTCKSCHDDFREED